MYVVDGQEVSVRELARDMPACPRPSIAAALAAGCRSREQIVRWIESRRPAPRRGGFKSLYFARRRG